jgi:hypothetical protein
MDANSSRSASVKVEQAASYPSALSCGTYQTWTPGAASILDMEFTETSRGDCESTQPLAKSGAGAYDLLTWKILNATLRT